MTGYAIDAAINYRDNYAFNGNNYYMYNHPTDRRFVFLPHGADSALTFWFSATQNPLNNPVTLLATRVRKVPALDTRF